jgi:hypothetical protein
MRSKCKRILSALLITGILFSVCSCKKKKQQEDIVKENDPYYQATVTDVGLDPEMRKGSLYFEESGAQIIGHSVVSSYEILHDYPEELYRMLDILYDPDSEDIAYILKTVEECYERGLVIYDLDGQELSRIDLPFNNAPAAIAEGRDGEILCLVSHTDFESFGQSWELLIYSMEGVQTGAVSLPDDLDPWTQTLMVTSDGKIIISEYGSISIFSANGELIGTLADASISGTVVENGGKYYVTMYDIPEDDDEGVTVVQELDVEKAMLIGERRALGSSMSADIISGGDGKCYTIDGNGIERVDLNSGKSEEFFKWDYTDVNYHSSARDSIRVVSDNQIAFLRTEYETDASTGFETARTQIVHLQRAEKNPHVGKKYIDMGTIGNPMDDLLDYVVSYNTREGNTSRIRVVDYSNEVAADIPYMKKQSMLAAKVYEDMLAGKGPDILVNFSCFSQFNSGEVLVDLNPYVDGKNGLNREEYFDNVLSAFENKDQLFQIPVCFDIRGLLGNREMIGERPGWTYSEFHQIVDSFPDDVSVFPYVEYEELLENLLYDSMLSFVNYSKKEVYFDGDEFRQLLSIVKEYGENLQDEEKYRSTYGVPMIDDDGVDNTPLRMMNDKKLALMPTEIVNLYQIAENRSILSGETVYIGMPSPDGAGVSAEPILTLAISAFSTSKEEAWDFIRRLFDEDSQYTYTSSLGSIPLNRKAFDRINEDSFSDNQMLVEQFEQNTQVDYMPMPEGLVRIQESDMQGFKELVEKTSTIVTSDPEIIAIIEDEAADYFMGLTTVDEVCSIIQQRASEVLSKR